MRISILIFTFIGAILSATVASSQETTPPPINKSALSKVMVSIDASKGLQRHHKACPADIFATIKSPDGGDDDLTNICRKNPAKCLKICLNNKNTQACFDLGLVFQDDDLKAKPEYAEMMFATACARGEPGGCTNRAAGIAVGNYKEDHGRKNPEMNVICAYSSLTD